MTEQQKNRKAPTSRTPNNIKTTSIIAEETQKQLQLLGYKKGDKVYLRAFYPEHHPKYKEDSGRKRTVTNFQQLVEIATAYQKEERGVYLVVNGGGQSDADVKECRAIFYEHDDLDKELQVDLWQSLGLPQPTFQVDTGGKSIHNYWVFETPIPTEDWRKIQKDLILYSQGDKQLINPSRVMRLCGCLHYSGQPSIIVSASGNRYSYQELRNLIPEAPKPTFTRKQNTSTFSSDEIPLYQCLTKTDRGFVDNGVGEGSRNSDGFRLAVNLIATEKRLVELGQIFSGSARELFEDFCERCSPPLDAREADKIWQSAEKSAKQPSLTDEYLENCIKAWQSKNNMSGVRSQVTGDRYQEARGKKQERVNTIPHSQIDLRTELSQLYERELQKSELEALFPEIANQHGRSSSEVRRIYDALSKEKNLERDRSEVKEQIPEIIQAQQSRLDPKQLFWGDGGRFAELLQRTADAMPTSVENLITTLIPVAGSRIGTAARVVINPTARYTQPAIYWSCVVAPTGRLKTPAQEVIISPLAKLEADEFRKWKVAKEDFDEELKRYKKNSDEEPPEPPAPRKRFLVQGATAETRIKLHSENPRGLLNYRDEWSSFINGRNKYRNGKGDDLELDLSEFNGNAILKDNSSENLFLERSSISRTGNTQPETLQKFLAATDYEDYTGEFARWLFCLVPGDVAYIELFRHGDNAGEELDQALTELYRRLGRFEEQDYFLTDGAKGVFQSYHRWLTDAEVAETHPGLRAAYPKLKSYLARLALWLHIVNSALSGCSMPPQFIEGKTMYIASYFVKFFLNQAKLLYSSFGREEGKLTAELLKVKEYIEKRPEGVAYKEIRNGILCLRKASKAEVEALCRNLIDLKMIRFEDKKYYPLLKNDHPDHPSPETASTQAVEAGDQGSPRITQDHPDFEKSEKVENSTQVYKNQLDTEREMNDPGDPGDLWVINDHPVQSQSQQAISALGDPGDQFSEETEKNISEDNTTDAIQTESSTEVVHPVENAQSFEWQGFRVGEPVKLIAHDKPELIGSTQIIKFLNITSIVFESGEFTYSYTDMEKISPPDKSNALEQQFPIGSWVRYNSVTGSKQLAQVVGHSIEDCLDLDGRDKSSIFGAYRAVDCQLIEQVERLQLGLSTKLKGRDLTRCPEFIVGQYYWSKQENKRVKLTTIEENTVAKFKSPEVLVMPDGGVPTRLKLDDLVATYESPAADVNQGDVVSVWVDNKRGEKVTKLGGVSRIDHQGVWVRFPLKGDKWTNAQKFYAHRVVKVE